MTFANQSYQEDAKVYDYPAQEIFSLKSEETHFK